MFDEPIEDADYTALPEDRPGGFNWGREVDNNANNEAQNNERRDGMWIGTMASLFFFLH